MRHTLVLLIGADRTYTIIMYTTLEDILLFLYDKYTTKRVPTYQVLYLYLQNDDPRVIAPSFYVGVTTVFLVRDKYNPPGGRNGVCSFLVATL